MRRAAVLLAIVALIAGLAAMPANIGSNPAVSPDFVHFESSHVHPAAMTPDGTKLLVVNTPDNRLSVFDLTTPTPTRIAEIPVGLEPVSVAARSNGEAWVVNNLSDDVSIVDLGVMHTKATLRVGDEPSDVVFAGSKAYVSVTQEDAIKAYDPTNLAAAPIVIPIPGRGPRALTRNLDGSEVLVDVFHSSAQSTALSQAEAGDSLPPPSPPLAPGLPTPPKTGLSIKRSTNGWFDQAGHLWNSKIPYQVPLVEVVYVSTASNTVLGSRGDIASILMGAASNPVTGAAAVTGTYAEIEIRNEPNLKGHVTEQRLAIVPSRLAARTEIQLNPHINYGVSPGPQSEADSSLGMPTGVCWSADGNRVYVTSLATNKLGVVDPSGAGAIRARVATVAGPTGVIADPARPRLYVVGRFHNQLQTLSTADFSSVAVAAIGFDPTPDAVVNGRKFFYGGFTSGHGDQSCASCHLFGDTDLFSWELGNPLGSMAPAPPGQTDPLLQGFHPMKGPMNTQSLRGLVNTGLLHWRGDRADLNAFNPAFVGLMGRASVLPDSEMAAFTAFVMPLVYPPNPNQNLDRTYPAAPVGQPSAARGQTFFMNTVVDGGALKCVDCHALPAGTNGQVIDHQALQESQDMKVPQLRNLYQKSGFTDAPGAVNKRGYGYTHDGSMDNLFDFLHFPGFNFGSGPAADATRRDVERFLLDFDTGMAPAVGYQLTFNGANNSDPTMAARMDTLETQSALGNCNLVAHGLIGSTPHGWFYTGGSWVPDQASQPSITRAELIAFASAGHELTITGVPLGTGQRMGIDRDRDGWRDGDELVEGTDPGDPASHPVAAAGMPGGKATGLRMVSPNPFRASTSIDYVLEREDHVTIDVFDVLGRTVRTVARDERQSAGAHRAVFDGHGDTGRALGSGLYFVRLRSAQGTWERPVMLVR
jgi:YVTN family beta-propeller protein